MKRVGEAIRNAIFDQYGLMRMWSFMATMLLTIAVACTAIVYTVKHFDESACRQLAGITALETRYDFPNGCFVKIDGRWIPSDKWVENTGN